jgi:hypothetical protein
MGRESRRRWASVLEAPLANLDACGYPLVPARPSDHCPVCGCLMGEHLAALRGETPAATALDNTGWIECERCDVSCDTWAITPTCR